MEEGNSGLMDVSEIWILTCTCCVEVRDCNRGPSCDRRASVQQLLLTEKVQGRDAG